MTDLQNFMGMMANSGQNYSMDEFYGVTRVQVKVSKFTNWMSLLTSKPNGVPMTMIYVFDKYGNFLSSAISI